jgi:cystathionine gamma-synthase
MKIETLAVHAAQQVDPESGAIAAPIQLSTTYARDEASALIGPTGYIREGSPTPARFETAMAALEGGEAALTFASGMAAACAVLETLPPASRLLLPEDAYYGVRVAASDFFAARGIATDIVAMDEPGRLEQALSRPATLVWLETPSNPMMKIVDLEAAIRVSRSSGAATIVDNTFATPALQSPLSLGADVVLHSATKYIGGHSDVQAGVLVFRRRDALFERVLHARHVLGAVASPFNAWLALRGLRTLPLRMERHSANALAVARALSAHPGVAAVHYPGLSSHPNHAVAARQMRAFGGMLSFRVRGGREKALEAVSRVRIFVRATSLGGTESLIEHRRTSEGTVSTTPDDLLRLSVGLEHADDLIADLRQALGT